MYMKAQLQSYFSLLVRDRHMLNLTIVNLLLAVSIIIVLMLSIQPHDVQVIARFSSYGITGFYRDYWHSMYVFPAMELLMVLGHVLLSMKLVKRQQRDLGVGLLYLTLILSGVLFIIARSMINIAALG